MTRSVSEMAREEESRDRVPVAYEPVTLSEEGAAILDLQSRLATALARAEAFKAEANELREELAAVPRSIRDSWKHKRRLEALARQQAEKS